VRRLAPLEREHQLMVEAIKRPHAGVRFVSHAQVLRASVYR
jgi:hypothetical protein